MDSGRDALEKRDALREAGADDGGKGSWPLSCAGGSPLGLLLALDAMMRVMRAENMYTDQIIVQIAWISFTNLQHLSQFPRG